jgi:PAS domain S-box-containing protein
VTLDDGTETRYLEARVAPFSDYHDVTVGYLVELRDVSDRERRERALSRFRTVFESVDDPVYVLDGDGRFTLVNESFASLVGSSRGALVGTPLSEVVSSPGDGATQSNDTPEYTLKTATGEVIPVETHQTPIEVEFEGFAGGAVGVVRDISERKRVEAELSRTTERYETLVESAPLAILAIDTEGCIERWNPAAESLFGWTTAEITGDPLPFVPETERDRFHQARIRVFDGEQVTDMAVVLEGRDGSRFDASVSLAPVFDTGGSVTGAVLVVADVTEQKERERALRQQNERLDQFASVVSHDLRNPLSVADGHVEVALESGDVEPLDTVRKAHERMETLIDDFLALAREGEAVTDPATVSLEPLVSDAWKMIETDEMTLELQDGLGTVEGDESRLRTLFENLFRNAADHAGPAPLVTVGPLRSRDGFFVADDGPGIPARQRHTVFESGHTRSPDGTGFGLSIVETIAEAHNWSITVQESVDGGARFEFETGPYGERKGDQFGYVPQGEATGLHREQ